MRYRHKLTFYLLTPYFTPYYSVVKRGTGSKLNSRGPSLSGNRALNTHDPAGDSKFLIKK